MGQGKRAWIYCASDAPEDRNGCLLYTSDTQSLAKFAFSMFWRAMRFVEEQQVPILLDY